MKKLLCLLLSMSVLLSGCSVLEEEVRQESVIPTETVEPEIAEQPVELSETEQQIRGLYSEYYPVLFIVKYKSNLLFNTDTTLKLYVDGEEVADLLQGDTSAYGVILSKGTHKLKIASSWLNADSYKFTVGEDTFLGNILNYFDITVQFKMNEAAIESIDGNTMTYNSTSYDAEENYNYAQTMIDLDLYHAIGNFDYVLNQYECRQINDAVVERHISANMDEWSWLDRGILFNLPVGMAKEPISLSDEELAEYSTSAGLKLLNDNCEAVLSIGIMEEMVNSGLAVQISDLFTEAELQDMASADIAEGGNIVESLETALSEYGEFKVFESKYTIVDGDIRKTGYSFCFFVDFAFCKAKFETRDESILDTIVGSINLYGTEGLGATFIVSAKENDSFVEKDASSAADTSFTPDINEVAQNTGNGNQGDNPDGRAQVSQANNQPVPSSDEDLVVDYDAIGKTLTGTWKNSVWYIYVTYLGNNVYDVVVCGYPGDVTMYPNWHLEASYDKEYEMLITHAGVYWEENYEYVSNPTTIEDAMTFKAYGNTMFWSGDQDKEYLKSGDNSFYGNIKVYYGVDPETWILPQNPPDDADETPATSSLSYTGEWENIGSGNRYMLIEDHGNGDYYIEIHMELMTSGELLVARVHKINAWLDSESNSLRYSKHTLITATYNAAMGTWDWNDPVTIPYDSELWFDSENQLHHTTTTDVIFVPYGSQGVYNSYIDLGVQ